MNKSFCALAAAALLTSTIFAPGARPLRRAHFVELTKEQKELFPFSNALVQAYKNLSPEEFASTNLTIEHLLSIIAPKSETLSIQEQKKAIQFALEVLERCMLKQVESKGERSTSYLVPIRRLGDQHPTAKL